MCAYLQVMVKQEVYRKLGYAIQADEEQLRVHLEAIQAELNAPTQFKVKSTTSINATITTQPIHTYHSCHQNNLILMLGYMYGTFPLQCQYLKQGATYLPI